MTRGIGVALLLSLLWVVPAHAQIPVTDVGNLFENTTQVIQGTLSLANQALDLLGLGEIVLNADDSFMNDMADIALVANDATAVLGDIRAVQDQIATLFDANTFPTTPATITDRYIAMTGAVRTARLYAIRTQKLAVTVLGAVQHIQRLVADIAAILGNNQANQTLIQLTATEAKLLAAMQLQGAAAERVDTLDRMSDDVLRSSLLDMRSHWMDGWPGLGGQ
jgi:hypothetical protein